MRASAWDRECRLVRQLNFGKHRTQFAPFANGPHRSHSTAWMFGSGPEKGRSDFRVGESARARLGAIPRLQRRWSSRAFRGGMQRLRCVANVHQYRRSGSDFTDCSAGADAEHRPDRKTAARQLRVEDRTQTDQFLSPPILRTVAKTEFRFFAQ